jgi:type I site-specific restriction endonuclease
MRYVNYQIADMILQAANSGVEISTREALTMYQDSLNTNTIFDDMMFNHVKLNFNRLVEQFEDTLTAEINKAMKECNKTGLELEIDALNTMGFRE